MSALFRYLRSSRKRRDYEDHNDIVLWARQRFASDFPNPTREDCPDPETLRAVVNRRQFPDADLKTHLLSCSNCFSEYRTALIAHRQRGSAADAVVIKPGLAPLLGLRPAVALALLLLIVSVAGVFLWSLRDTSEKHVRYAPPSESPAAATPTPLISNEQTPQEGEAKQPPHEALAVRTVNIDLERFQQSREPSNNNARTIQLKRGVNDLVIKLPLGSPNGTYRITLADSFGKEEFASSAKRYTGRAVRSKLNLSSFTEGTYMLCVSANDEAPDCVPARISNR
jgi:hypothetical protein